MTSRFTAIVRFLGVVSFNQIRGLRIARTRLASRFTAITRFLGVISFNQIRGWRIARTRTASRFRAIYKYFHFDENVEDYFKDKK